MLENFLCKFQECQSGSTKGRDKWAWPHIICAKEKEVNWRKIMHSVEHLAILKASFSMIPATSFCSCSSDGSHYWVRRYKVVNLLMVPTWDILRGKATVPRWNSSVSFLTGTLRFEDRRKGEEGLPCQGLPIYSIFLCQLSRFCFPFPWSILPSASITHTFFIISSHFFSYFFFFY